MYINSLNKTNYIKNVDTGSSIHLMISDYNESLIDLTSYDSVEVVIGDDTGRLRVINPTLESETGELSFDFTSDDLLPKGQYYLEVHLIESDGSIRVAPSERKFYINVTKSLDEVGDTVNVITIQEFEQRISDAETAAYDAGDYANEQGDFAKAEADRLKDTDVSTLDNRLTSHEDNTNNPHNVTKSQVGLGNVDDVQQASKTDFDNLVARVGNNANLNTNEKSKIILALNEVNNKADDNADNLTAHKADNAVDAHAELPRAEVTHSVSQSLASDSATAILFDSENYDNDSIHDPTTNNSRLICHTDGVYVVYGHFTLGQSSDSERRVVQIRKNGETRTSESKANLTGVFMDFSISFIVNLSVSDYVEFFARQDSGSSVDVINPVFGMVKVG